MAGKEEKEDAGSTTDSDTGNDGPNASPPIKTPSKTDAKKMEEIRKTLGGDSLESQMETLLGRHSVALEEAALAKKNLKTSRKATGAVIRERDFLKSELEKSMLGKAKMEALCRELQKASKKEKTEWVARLREAEEKRKELSDQFKASLGEIEKGMGAGKERSQRLSKENLRLSRQLEALAEKYEAKAEQSTKLVEMREASAALLEAKLAQAQTRLDELNAEAIGDKEGLIGRLKERESQLSGMIDVERELRGQLDTYAQRYKDFQANVDSSNAAFTRFQAQMDELTAELTAAQQRNVSLEKELKEASARNATLEKVTRALQEERNLLLKQTTPDAPKESPPSAKAANATTTPANATSAPPPSACGTGCCGPKPTKSKAKKGK